jgi:hypothetical protein
MDQMSEHSETQELRELLMEILKVQELILQRVSQLEERIATEKRP